MPIKYSGRIKIMLVLGHRKLFQSMKSADAKRGVQKWSNLFDVIQDYQWVKHHQNFTTWIKSHKIQSLVNPLKQGKVKDAQYVHCNDAQ